MKYRLNMQYVVTAPVLVLLMVVLGFYLSSCDDLLNPEVVTSLTEEDVIRSYGNTQSTLNAIYTYLPNGFFYVGDAMMACASDEAEFTVESASIQKFNTGAWNSIDNPDNAWRTNYSGIYASNLFLSKVDSVRMDYLKYNPSSVSQEQYQTNLRNMHRWKYEARFLRAFFYSELVKRYGGVPLIGKPIGLNDNYRDIPRSPLSECIQFIADECDSAALVLPLAYSDDGDYGRVTKGTALALKSRVLLYAASDLFNDPSWAGSVDEETLGLISMTDNKTREERWKLAAEAAADVIKLGVHKLHSTTNGGYKALFRTYNSEEIILARRFGSDNYFEKVNYPIGYDLGNSGATPTGNLVDDYEVLVGARAFIFDWSDPDHKASPYANRDPRLGYSVLTNDASFKGDSIEAWTGGKDGKDVAKSSKTGYYLNKYIDPDLDLLQGYNSVHTWIVIRYAEILLNYAEAVNELTGPGGTITGVSLNARNAVRDVRVRAGMPPPSSSVSKVDLQQIIRRERRVEFAFEDHRLWDVRRWMIAPETLGTPITGVEVKRIGDDQYEYNPIVLENRVFENKMYLYPIPQKELEIAQSWKQNPGW